MAAEETPDSVDFVLLMGLLPLWLSGTLRLVRRALPSGGALPGYLIPVLASQIRTRAAACPCGCGGDGWSPAQTSIETHEVT